MHRNLGVFTTRGVDLDRLFRQLFGKDGGFTKGRDRTFHFGLLEQAHRRDDQPPRRHAAGGRRPGAGRPAAGRDAAWRRRSPATAATSEGDFHEAAEPRRGLEAARALRRSRTTSTGCRRRSRSSTRAPTSPTAAPATACPGVIVDGNDVLAVHGGGARGGRARPRAGDGPTLLEFKTFRMRGHEEASGTAYVPQAPVRGVGAAAIPSRASSGARRPRRADAPERATRCAPSSRPTSTRSWTTALGRRRARLDRGARAGRRVRAQRGCVGRRAGDRRRRRPRCATSTRSPTACARRCAADDRAVLHRPGHRRVRRRLQGDRGVRRGVRQGARAQHADHRVGRDRRAPWAWPSTASARWSRCSSATSSRCGFNQIVNNLAKTHYRWGAAVPVVVRVPVGGGMGAGPFHSQNVEAWFTHVAGLKVVAPATPADAKGLLLAAFEDGNPVLYLEHKLLYRSARGRGPGRLRTRCPSAGRASRARDATPRSSPTASACAGRSRPPRRWPPTDAVESR